MWSLRNRPRVEAYIYWQNSAGNESFSPICTRNIIMRLSYELVINSNVQ